MHGFGGSDVSNRRAPIGRTAPAKIERKQRSACSKASDTARAILQRRPVDLDGLTDHLGYLIRRAQLWIFQDFIRTLAFLEIRPAQYSVLTVINANPGLPQMGLANALGIERARLVHVLNGLEARNLVQRVPSTNDRRSHALHLTDHGRKTLSRIKVLASEHERHVEQKLGAEHRKELLRLLAAFASG